MATSAQGSIAERMQKLEDIEAIRRLTALWCRSLDTQDLELMSTIIDKDVALVLHGTQQKSRQLQGSIAFLEFYRGRLGHYAFTRHNFCNHDIIITDKTATLDCYSIIEFAFPSYHTQPEFGIRGMVKNHWDLRKVRGLWRVSLMDIQVQTWTEGPVKPAL